MTFEEIEKLVIQKQDMPKHSSLEELFCFNMLYQLYRDFYGKRLSREEAKTKKREIQGAFDQAVYNHTLYRAAYAQYQESIRQAGHLRAEILKGLESGTGADKLLLLAMECIGRITGEMRTYEIVRDKLAPDAKMQE